MHAKSAAAMCAISTFFTLSPAFAEQPSPTPAVTLHAASNESPTAMPRATPSGTATADSSRVNGARTPRPASSADRSNYAARESASPDAQQYQGGDSVVVIGASTATVILAVILLVVLI